MYYIELLRYISGSFLPYIFMFLVFQERLIEIFAMFANTALPVEGVAQSKTVVVRASASYNFDFPAALTFFHRAFAIAESFALAAALIVRLTFLTGFTADFFPFKFAQRFFAAALILALPAVLIFRLFFGAT